MEIKLSYFHFVVPAGVLGITGWERKILDTSASCIPGFANISTLPTLMTPSTHVSIMVDFCIFIEKKTRYKKEKHEWREEHLFKSGLCYPIISWLSKFMNWHILHLCWLNINILFLKLVKGFLSVKNSKASMNARRKYGARTNKNTGIPVFFTEVKALFYTTCTSWSRWSRSTVRLSNNLFSHCLYK